MKKPDEERYRPRTVNTIKSRGGNLEKNHLTSSCRLPLNHVSMDIPYIISYRLFRPVYVRNLLKLKRLRERDDAFCSYMCFP